MTRMLLRGCLVASFLLTVAALPAEAQPSTVVDYLRVDPDSGCTRIQGTGLPQWQETFTAIGWNNGPNAVPQATAGDDVDVGAVTVTWSLPDTLFDAHSGSFGLTESPLGDYTNNINISARIDQSFDLSAAASCEIEFWHHYNFETNYDYGYLEVNAGSGWTVEKTYNVSPGEATAFYFESVDLSAYLGQTIDVRFRVDTDGSVTRDGWTIDDLIVRVDGFEAFTEDFESGLGNWQLDSPWGLTDPVALNTAGSIDPVTGVFSAGAETGETFVTATYNGDIQHTVHVLILPPDWMP